MFCCSQVPHFTATFTPHKQDSSHWKLNLLATHSKRKQPGSSRMVRAGNSPGITPCLTRKKVSKRKYEESPKPKSEFRGRIPDYRSSCSLILNQVPKVMFINSHVSARNITQNIHSTSSLGAEHAIFFLLQHGILLQQLCILQNAQSPDYCSLCFQNGVMDIFRLVPSLLLRSLRLKFSVLSPATPESINSPSFWQHVVPGTKPTTSSAPKPTTAHGPTTSGASGEAAYARSTQLYSSLDSDLE